MFWLIIVCTTLAAATFGFAWLPVILPLAKNKLSLISIFGTGLLAGCAFAVVVPEGFSLVLRSDATSAGAALKEQSIEQLAGLALLAGFLTLFGIDVLIARSEEVATTRSQYISVDALRELNGVHPVNGHRESHEASGPGALATTASLVIHSLADGIALGDASLPTYGGWEARGNEGDTFDHGVP